MFTAMIFSTLWLATIIVTTRYFKRQWREIASLNTSLSQLRNDMNTTCDATAGIGRHVREIESKVIDLNERQTELNEKTEADASYLQAAKLIKMGASIHDVMESCALTRAEAELVATLERSKQY